MSVYLDASVIIALIVDDAHSARANRLAKPLFEKIVVSDFAAAEFASAISRKCRTGELSRERAREALADFDRWAALTEDRPVTLPSDIAMADALLRRLDLSLRTPDALNIAIALRLGAELLTLDRRMAEDAATLGLTVRPSD